MHYGGSSHKHGGVAACPNDFRVKRAQLEDGLLADIRRELLLPEAIEDFGRRVVKRLAGQTRKPDGRSVRLTELGHGAANLTDAIARGVLRTSPALAARLAQAAPELSKPQTAQAPPSMCVVLSADTHTSSQLLVASIL